MNYTTLIYKVEQISVIIDLIELAVAESRKAFMKSFPSSNVEPKFGSIGIVPKTLVSYFFASIAAFPKNKITKIQFCINLPLLNIFVHSEQCGQTNPDIFSTIPHIGSSVFLQKLISLVTSWSEAICGVVTSTARTEFLLSSSLSVDTSPICSSEVPGGVSITRTSSAPQTTSFISWATIAFFFGPRQIIASSASARNPTETSYNANNYLF